MVLNKVMVSSCIMMEHIMKVIFKLIELMERVFFTIMLVILHMMANGMMNNLMVSASFTIKSQNNLVQIFHSIILTF
jgi:hypothetical protein